MAGTTGNPAEPHWHSVPGTPPAVPASLLAVLRAGAAARSDEPALIGSAARLGTAQLLAQALAVAHAIAASAPPGAAVATLVPQDPAGTAAVLGCLISGRICVPLSPADPAERLRLTLAEARPALLLAGADAPDGMPRLDPTALPPALTGWLPPESDPDAPAAVHFTSGSSGRPKGIAVSHFALLRRAALCRDDWALAPGERVLATSGPAVGSGLAFMVATLMGQATSLVAGLATEGAGALLRLMARERAAVLVAGPTIVRALVALPGAAAALAGLRHVRMGAMALPAADVWMLRAILPAGCAISHTYASTEAMVVARWTIPPGAEDAAPTLAAGHFAPGQDYALLDAEGAEGELLLRGRHIALGEWQEGRLVPGRMPPDPARPGWRVFRTGDVVRLQPDGMVRVLGRADRLLKINGVRVEPGEIEAILRATPGVTDAAVVPSAGGLHGFVAGQDAAVLRAALSARLRAALPPALRPSRLTVLDALPLLPIGKVDLVALRRMADDGRGV